MYLESYRLWTVGEGKEMGGTEKEGEGGGEGEKEGGGNPNRPRGQRRDGWRKGGREGRKERRESLMWRLDMIMRHVREEGGEL